MKKVLVTGAGGFLGSRVVQRLGRNYSVYALSRSGQPIQGAEAVAGDLRQKASLENSDALKEIEILVHLAALVPGSFSAPADLEDLVANNVIGTKNLCECLPSVKHVCLASTIEVYGRPERVPVTEDSPLRPITPYGLSKLFQEEYMRYFCGARRIKLAILRFATIYGPGEKYARAIPNFVKAAKSGQPLQISGAGRVKRDYVYVDDAAASIELALKRGKAGEFNVTGGQPVSIIELARMIAKLCGTKLEIERRPPRANSFDNYLSPDKARRLLGFKAATRLQDGLKKEIGI